MIERILILGLIAGASMLAWQALRVWQTRRATRAAGHDPLLRDLRAGVPAIVYFTSPTCVPCQTQQRPAIARLLDEWGERVQVIEINALSQPDAANRWGVLSIPTTFILDRDGMPRQVNRGVTGPEKLKQQLLAL